MKQSFCRACGCTWDNPCHHPDYGPCWWANDACTLCSHCSDEEIRNDPRTEHCVNDFDLYSEAKTHHSEL